MENRDLQQDIESGKRIYDDEKNEKKYGEIYSDDETHDRIDNYERRVLAKLKEIAPDGVYSPDIIKRTFEALESELVKFHVGEQGLSTEVSEVLTEDEWGDTENLPSNHIWSTIVVRNEADMKKWVKLRNELPAHYWTPNQYYGMTRDERGDASNQDAIRIEEIQREMGRLEVF